MKTATITPAECQLIAFALRFAASNMDDSMLEALGMDEIDAKEHGTEESGFTDADIDQVLLARQESLEDQFRQLAERFEKEPCGQEETAQASDGPASG